MSKLDDQIKELNLRKTKVECLAAVNKSLKDVTEKYKDAGAEVKALIKGFIDAQINMVEEGVSPNILEPGFSAEEVSVLKQMINKIISKGATKPVAVAKPVENNAFSKEPVTETSRAVAEANDHHAKADKIRFALQNSHLSNKRVKVEDGDASSEGVVVGIDAPNIIVKTDNGLILKVTLDKILA